MTERLSDRVRQTQKRYVLNSKVLFLLCLAATGTAAGCAREAPSTTATTLVTATEAVDFSCANRRLPADIVPINPGVTGSPLRSIHMRLGTARLTLAVADEPEAQEKGLMCVRALRPNAGMLFLMGSQSTWNLWMKDTLIPLDMIWIDETGTITKITRNVPTLSRATPDSEIPRYSGVGRYVIELPAGSTNADSIQVGQRLPIE